VLVGVAVLPLLPPTGPEGSFASKVTRTIASAPIRAQKSERIPAPTPPVAATPATPTPPAAATPAPAAATPAATVTPPPAPAPAPVVEAWTDAEQAATLRECVQLLAPVAVDIAVEDPVKHGQCGTPAPVLVRSIGTTDKVELSPAPTMNCRLAAQLAGWVETVLQPTAREVLGTRITRIVGASSYSCRNIYNMAVGPLSEHATGAAIDIAGFVTADGRTIRVAKAWGPTERDIAEAHRKEIAAQASAKKASAALAAAKAKDEATAADKPTPSIEDAAKKSRAADKPLKAGLAPDAGKRAAPPPAATVVAATTVEATFLKRLHKGACATFGTVLGPEANEAHRDHFHLDVKERRSSHGVCH
jgi:hypothetical protein